MTDRRSGGLRRLLDETRNCFDKLFGLLQECSGLGGCNGHPYVVVAHQPFVESPLQVLVQLRIEQTGFDKILAEGGHGGSVL